MSSSSLWDQFLIQTQQPLFLSDITLRDLRSFEIRFEFESDWPIRKFSNRIGRACFFARRKLSQTTQTINGA